MTRALVPLLAAALLAGCAATHLDANVHTTGRWPAGRPPGTYAFQRLPSQQEPSQDQDTVEADARPALAAAGLRLVAPDAAVPPDTYVQVAARATQVPAPVDPFYGSGWIAPPPGAWRFGGWGGGWGAGWGYGAAFTMPWVTLTEVSVLMLDLRSGQTLYESRAQTDAGSGDAVTRAALFAAALRDFPHVAVSPRRVRVDLAPPAAASAPAR